MQGPLLVFAGAGSGKTRVITYRIANLVARERVAPWRILAVTFTNKAAGEMRNRLERPDMLGPVARARPVGRHVPRDVRQVPPPLPGGHRAQQELRHLRHDGPEGRDRRARSAISISTIAATTPKQVLARIHKEKQEGRGPDEMSLDSYLDDAIQKAYRKYEAALRGANALDFEDLILGVVRILEAPADGSIGVEVLRAQEALEKKYDHVLVDEFQDTNQIQSRLIKALAGRTPNVCVVGDDDQSIYRWPAAPTSATSAASARTTPTRRS